LEGKGEVRFAEEVEGPQRLGKSADEIARSDGRGSDLGRAVDRAMVF
jgi:hypothetical protein